MDYDPSDYRMVEARYVRDFVVWFRFKDGTAGEVDLEPSLRGPVFEPLHDLEYFKKFQVHPEYETIVWPNGADLAPDTLYGRIRSRAAVIR